MVYDRFKLMEDAPQKWTDERCVKRASRCAKLLCRNEEAQERIGRRVQANEMVHDHLEKFNW